MAERDLEVARAGTMDAASWALFFQLGEPGPGSGGWNCVLQLLALQCQSPSSKPGAMALESEDT